MMKYLNMPKGEFSNELFIDDEGDLTVYSQGWITNISAAQYMIDVIVSKSLMVIFHTRPNTSARSGL